MKANITDSVFYALISHCSLLLDIQTLLYFQNSDSACHKLIPYLKI